MKNSLLQLTLIHFKEFIREPGILFWSIIFPILMAWVLGVAFSRKPETNQSVALVQTEQVPESPMKHFLAETRPGLSSYQKIYYQKELHDSILGKTTFRFFPVSWDSAILMLKRGQASLILTERQGIPEFHFDPRNPDAKLAYLTLSKLMISGKLITKDFPVMPLSTIGTRYIDFLVPGLLALGLMNSIVWGICYGLIEMRVKRLLRRMIATPMRKSEFLLSLFIARFTLGVLEAAILLTFAKIYFDITILGSFPAFILVFLAGNIAFGGLSILLSSRVENTRIGAGVVNFVTMPMMVLSGIFFSYQNFPEGVVRIIKLLPLTMIADSFRSIFLEGAGLREVMLPVIILSILGFSLFAIGLKIYKWY